MIKYTDGDLFKSLPHTPDTKVIPHIVNDIGAWGSGFVVPLSKRFPIAEESYRAWYNGDELNHPGVRLKLGEVQFVPVQDPIFHRDELVSGPIFVANMVAQHQTIRENPKPIRYVDLACCLKKVAEFCSSEYDQEKLQISIHAPKFGSGLARGDWNLIALLIDEAWADISTNVYRVE